MLEKSKIISIGKCISFLSIYEIVYINKKNTLFSDITFDQVDCFLRLREGQISHRISTLHLAWCKNVFSLFITKYLGYRYTYKYIARHFTVQATYKKRQKKTIGESVVTCQSLPVPPINDSSELFPKVLHQLSYRNKYRSKQVMILVQLMQQQK